MAGEAGAGAGPVVGPLEGFARRWVAAAFDAVVTSPPAGVTAREARAIRRRIERDMVHEALGKLQPHRALILDRLGVSSPARRAPAVGPGPLVVPAELMGAAERTEANLAAMQLLADKPEGPFTQAEQATLAAYSGWGGLSLQKAEGRFPAGLPTPEKRGLIHEYYTRSDVAQAVGQLIRAWPVAIPRPGTGLPFRALEPSAGIGRFLAGLEQAGVSADWTAIEYSEVSARLLQARFGRSAEVYHGPFERWAAHNDHKRFGLVVCNPPYGARGASKAEDAVGQRIRAAYHYFVSRATGLLQAGGLGVFVVPGGLMTGTGRTATRLRADLLRTAHLSCAFRLPSVSTDGKVHLFPGANLVVDLVVVTKREGTLDEVLEADADIRDGKYFSLFPGHVLGEEVGADKGEDDSGKKRRGRWGYEIRGDFTGLPTPELGTVVRPMDDAKGRQDTRTVAQRGSVVAQTVKVAEDAALPVRVADALGLRIAAYLSALQDDEPSPDLLTVRGELVADVEEWVERNGDPATHPGLAQAARRRVTGVEAFLAATDGPGGLGPALAEVPALQARYQGPPELTAIAGWLARQEGAAAPSRVVELWEARGGTEIIEEMVVEGLEEAGWCQERDGRWVSREDYTTGHLWPKLDALEAMDEVFPERAARQRELLITAIAPVTWSDIVAPAVVRESDEDVLGDGGLTPRDRFVPAEVLMAWQHDSPDLFGLIERESWGPDTRLEGLELEWDRGTLQVKGWDYADLPTNKDGRKRMGVAEPNDTADGDGRKALLNFVGWVNGDLRLWSPRVATLIDEDGEERKESLDAARVRVATSWILSFRQWVQGNAEAQEAIETAYNRTVRGYRPRRVDTDPVSVARWDSPITLHPYQMAGCKRLLQNRKGVLAFDVGLGKTYTGIFTMARARQEGWARRPAIVVPNSLVWKWWRDIKKVLPDYRVLVVGSNRKKITRGRRKGKWASETDSPEERARKWRAFQAGAYDVVLITQSMIGRTRIQEETLTDFAGKVAGIRRLATLARQSDDGREKKAKKASERKKAVQEEASSGWLMQMLQGNVGQDYDPGLSWEELGIDFLMVDESQNYKNLFMAEQREGGVPDGLGSGNPSKRAWHLAFRAHAVRQRSGGGGVVLLSATPAKNSPLEFYNAVAVVDPHAFERIGITDPETFISRYCLTEQAIAQKPDGTLVVRSAVRAFGNLDELRDVLFSVAEFKTAEDVGLRIPEAIVRQERVELSGSQKAAIAGVMGEIHDIQEEIRKLAARLPETAGQIEALRLKVMGLSAKIDLIAQHTELPEHSGKAYKKKSAAQVELRGHAPKLEACARNIIATMKRDGVCSEPPDGCDSRLCFSCAHIIFVENIAVHDWMKRLLVEGGVPAKRIAILNAKVAKDVETRQQIAERFNGVGCPDDDEFAEPAFDVVICNAVAYEGVDLQRRTCAIHHLDLPWEPATLQQRNGRGVRQGALASEISITYYLAKGSLDIRRLMKIDTKQSWMASLVASQERATNNPAAGSDLTVAQIVAELASPEQRKAALEWERQDRLRQEEARRQRTARAANSRLLAAADRFRRAFRSEPATAERLRREGEAILRELARVSTQAWPWYELGLRVREEKALVPSKGPPLFAGMRFRVDKDLYEVGRLDGAIAAAGGVPLRKPGELGPEGIDLRESGMAEKLAELTPEALDVDWPALDTEREAWRRNAERANPYSESWGDLAIRDLPDAVGEEVWPVFFEMAQGEYHWLRRRAELTYSYATARDALGGVFPVLVGGRLELVPWKELWGRLEAGGDLFEPTLSGWCRWLKVWEAERGRRRPRFKVAQGREVARFWWGWRSP